MKSTREFAFLILTIATGCGVSKVNSISTSGKSIASAENASSSPASSANVENKDAVDSAHASIPAPEDGQVTSNPNVAPSLNSDVLPKSEKIDYNALSDAQVQTFLKSKCASCHENSKDVKAPFARIWALPDAMTSSSLASDPYAPNFYMALANKLSTKPLQYPAQMPQGSISDDDTKMIQGILHWVQKAAPNVVTDSYQKYGIPNETPANLSLSFQCQAPVTLRSFLFRFTMSAFDRSPKPEEIALFPAEQLDKAVTIDQRKKLVARLSNESKDEFLDIGLKKFAYMVGGAPAIKATDSLDDATLSDLKQEFYQLLRKHYDEWAYKQYFTSETVMVSNHTAPMYGCFVSDDKWQECTMRRPRSGFFTTLGYLNSKRSSFLIENNNYGRVAMIYYTLFGESLKAATNGPKGDGTVPALPSCLEQMDFRRYKDAPRGTAAVPSFGTTCQGCHLSRNLAAGSILFRPFSLTGLIYDPSSFDQVDPNEFNGATSADWTRPVQENTDKDSNSSTTKQVDKAFLKALLDNPIQTCVAPSDQSKPYIPVTYVKDLVSQLMQNEDLLARGFAVHAQRSYLNSSQPNLDVVYDLTDLYRNSKNKLPDMFNSFFMAESFSCSGGGNP